MTCRNCTCSKCTGKPRERREVTTAEYAEGFERQLVRYVERVGDGDTEDLRTMLSVFERFKRLIPVAIDRLRIDQGYSWADVGEVAGTTRQAAQERWGHRG